MRTLPVRSHLLFIAVRATTYHSPSSIPAMQALGAEFESQEFSFDRVKPDNQKNSISMYLKYMRF